MKKTGPGFKTALQDNKMKVANITLDARLAGPQLSIVRVGKILRDHHQIETVVILPKKGSGKFVRILKQHQIDFTTLWLNKLSKRPLNMALWLITFIPQVFLLSRAIKKLRVDLIHCSGSWQFKGIIAGKLAGKKIIWHMNDSKIPRMVRIIFKRLNRWADGFIFTGGRVKKYYQNLIKGKVIERVINAPVDADHYNPRKPVEASFLKNQPGLKIITLANVNPVKGIENFVEAAVGLSKRFDNLQFYVIGGLLKSQKKYIRRIRQLILDNHLENFDLSGFCDDVRSVLKDADIYVCTSISEASPMSVWEAMAMEKPVVSTDVGSVSVYIKNGENGFVVPVGDSDKIAERIGYLVEHPRERTRFGKKAREMVENYLDNSKTATRYADIYREVQTSGSTD
jgi:glycosyltransferase involved in cell wall biosynthesis